MMVKTLTTEPSRSRALLAADVPLDLSLTSFDPTPHPEDSNLYELPEPLVPFYRPLPLLLRLCLGVLSLLTATRVSPNTIRKQALVFPALVWRRLVTEPSSVSWKAVFLAVFKAAILYVLTASAVQELIPSCRPSRIATKDLVSKFSLPSPLSRYDDGIHWLEHYHDHVENDGSATVFQAGYVNHGFGASSLSWLPAIPKLADKLKIRSVIGHDAPGFGFTDRAEATSHYTFDNSAMLGSFLLEKQIKDPKQPVLLLGHSMGSLTTLRMALHLDPATKFRVVLVAPALGFLPNKSPNRGWIKSLRRPFTPITDMIAMYLLRRVVGWKNSWRKGLEAVWGDPKALKDSDVLRFQWPSIGSGWERGLLQFTEAQSEGSGRCDKELLKAVLDAPNCMGVDVIVGSKDKIVPMKHLRNFFRDFKVNISEMAGLGHDPFEEDTEGFVRLVHSLLNQHEK